jgi:phenylacetate-CoA ligase
MKKAGLLVPAKYNDPAGLIRDMKAQSEFEITHRGEARALKLFHEMARRVPAYKDFLRRQKVSPEKIKTIGDFKNIPTIDKQNYLRAYPLEKLCWDGDFKDPSWIISSTSGSTGEPFYFPREKSQDMQYVGTAELYLRTNFEIQKKSTLYIDAFPLGPWIGGIFTYEAIRTIAQKGYSLSIITTGVNKKEIINAVKNFGSRFDQVIIGCYAPFLKDALDDGVRQGLRWEKYNLKFVFSAEGFSETFRDYIKRVAGLKNVYLDTLNHYGTVDQGTLAYETPLSILIRRIAITNDSLYEHMFHIKHKLPTLCQYDPELFFFEEISHGLLCSSYSGLPLVRYDLKDHGGVIRYEDMMKKITDAGFNIRRLARIAGIQKTIWALPFVFVHERFDLSASLYAFLVYPETIRKALQEKKFRRMVTGKFTMITRYDKNQNQYLEINVELKAGEKGSGKLKNDVQKAIIIWLLRENSEFWKTYNEIGPRIYPRIVFWPYEDPMYFKPGGKQKWVIKNK